MTLPRQAMLFAAGFGTRMGALTEGTPKPLLEVAGRSLLALAIERLRLAGVERIVVNTHYHADQVRIAVPEDVILSHEPVILETGGGLQAALHHFDAGPLLTVNPDALWHPAADPWDHLAQAWRPDLMAALLLMVPRERASGTRSQGDFFVAPDGRLRRRAQAPTAPFIYSGMQVLDPATLLEMEPGAFSLNVLWNRYAAEGRLFGTVCDADWVDVGNPEGLRLANMMAERGHV